MKGLVAFAAALGLAAASGAAPAGVETRDATRIRPLGLSPGGVLAYRQSNPDCTCETGRCSEWIPLCGYADEPPEQCQRPCLPEEVFLVDLASGETLKSGRLTPEDVAAAGVEPRELAFVGLPHEQHGDVYAIERQGCAELGDLEGDWEAIQECSVFLVSERRGRKRVYSFRSKELRGFHLLFGGALFDPEGRRAALLLRQGHAPFEDEGPSRLFFVGVDLAAGFTRDVVPEARAAVPEPLLGSWSEVRTAPDGSFYHEPECGPDASVSFLFERHRVSSQSSGAADEMPFDEIAVTDGGFLLRRAGVPEQGFEFVGEERNVFRAHPHGFYAREPLADNPAVTVRTVDCNSVR